MTEVPGTVPAPSGRQITIAAGSVEAVVVEVGGGLRCLRAAGVDVLDGFGEADRIDAGRGQLLTPWPNRVAGGRYSFGGQDLQLAITEPARGNAIHGLGRWARWEVVAAEPDRAVLACRIPPQPGWPFQLSVSVEYAVDATGLRVTTTALNEGRGPAPYGTGHHPYFALGAQRADEVELRIPADAVLEVDERLIPTGRRLDLDATTDFHSARQVGEARLDTCYTRLVADADGLTRVAVRGPAGAAATLWMDGSHRFLMVFTGDSLPAARRRRSVALEPMTCAPDALNSGDGLAVIAPGVALTTRWGITFPL